MKELIISYLEKLPEPFRSQALENANDSFMNNSIFPSIEQNYKSALACAFDWEDTPQGFDYWDDYRQSLTDYNPTEDKSIKEDIFNLDVAGKD